ncbi:MAG: hypothetical protein ACRCSI_09700, partial [Eubacterium aggregans]
LRLSELSHHRLNGGAKKFRGRNRGIEEKSLLFLPDVRQVQPQMSLRSHHSRHRTTDGDHCLFGGPESKIRGAAELGHVFRGLDGRVGALNVDGRPDTRLVASIGGIDT